LKINLMMMMSLSVVNMKIIFQFNIAIENDN